MGQGLKRARKATRATRKPELKKGESWRKGYSTGYNEAKKAFGGCEKCYGKGYSTQIVVRTGGKILTNYNTCVCARGKQVDAMLEDVIASARNGVRRQHA